MLKIPKRPKTEPAVIKLGVNAISVILIDLKIINNIKPIAAKTNPKDLICDENSDCSILLYKTANPVTLNCSCSKSNLLTRSKFNLISNSVLFYVWADSRDLGGNPS